MSHPEMAEYEEEMRKGRRKMWENWVNYLVSSLVYSTFIWFFLRELNKVDAISFQFSWPKAAALTFAFQFVRVWDRAFMR